MGMMTPFRPDSCNLKYSLGIRKICMIAGLLTILFLMLWAPLACNSGTQSSVPDQSQTTLTDQGDKLLDGATLLAQRCSTCHGSDKVQQIRKSGEAWDKTVSRMISKGARLSEKEKMTLLDYLKKNYGQ